MGPNSSTNCNRGDGGQRSLQILLGLLRYGKENSWLSGWKMEGSYWLHLMINYYGQCWLDKCKIYRWLDLGICNLCFNHHVIGILGFIAKSCLKWGYEIQMKLKRRGTPYVHAGFLKHFSNSTVWGYILKHYMDTFGNNLTIEML